LYSTDAINHVATGQIERRTLPASLSALVSSVTTFVHGRRTGAAGRG